MRSDDAVLQYRLEAIENAPPLKIVRMLHQGAIRFLDRACATDPAAAPREFHRLVGRVDDIVCELRCALDPERAPEVAERLENLYVFIEGELAEATVERDAARLPAVRRLLETLLDAWTRVDVHGAAA